MKVNDLVKMQDRVKDILTYCEAARKDDKILYLEYIRRYRQELLAMPVEKFFRTKVPSYESITRARRKAQELDPSLKDSQVADMRAEEETEYIKFSGFGK